jgi:DNA (cytosine-5)-methyltransferase 1
MPMKYPKNKIKDRKEALQATPGDTPWGVFGGGLYSASGPKHTMVSLFSGCGGVDLGFHFAGFKTLWANDINEDAAATFKKNLGDITVGDITKTALPNIKEKVDVLVAGFPCQPFSNAGSRLGLSDTRGTLFQDALRAVDHFEPKVVVFENVRGLLSFKTSKKPLVQVICDKLAALGYRPSFKLVDASDYRVGQRRLRLLIVGVSERLGEGFAFPQPRTKDELSIGQMLKGIKASSNNQAERIALNPQAVALGAFVPEGGSWKDIPDSELPPRLKKLRKDIKRYRWPNFYRRFHRDEVAGTVTAAFKPENAGVWHPVTGDVMSVREIARIQSFPDWFVFEGKTVKSKYQQIGNAVPPRLAYEVALCVKRTLAGAAVQAVEPITFKSFLELGRPFRPADPAVAF